MRYRHLTDTALASKIGETGLSEDGFTRALLAAAPAHDRLCQLSESGRLPALAAAAREDDLGAARELAQDWRARLSDVLVLGAGGASLAAQALTALGDGMAGPAGPRLRFLDGVDPDALARVLGVLDPRKAGVLAISGSGADARTLAQALVVLPEFETRIGRSALARQAAVVTQAAPSPLGALAERYRLPRFAHDPEIGARFAVLSLPALLPALLAGVDVAAVRLGAREVLRATLEAARVEDSAPATGAALVIGLLHERQVSQSVLLTYRERLAGIGPWYRHLWAESLGKDGTGTTPIHSRAAADHRGQLQLYLAGPRDKLFTMVLAEAGGAGPRPDPGLARAIGAPELAGRPLGDVLDAGARAVATALGRHGRPVRAIHLDTLDEAALGALLMHFMLETLIAADLLGVNAFDRPAVEQGRRLARQFLDRTAP